MLRLHLFVFFLNKHATKKTTRPTYKNELAARGYKFINSSHPTGF